MSNKLVILQNGILINFETNDSDINFILLERRFLHHFQVENKSYSCFIIIITVRVFVSKQLCKNAKFAKGAWQKLLKCKDI